MGRRTIHWVLALGAAVAAAALLAAPVHGLMAHYGLQAGGPDVPPEASQRDFLKTFRGLLQLFLLTAIFLKVRIWRFCKFSVFESLGFPRRLDWWRKGIGAALLTMLSCALLLAVHYFDGWLTFEDPIRWGRAAERILHFLGTGIIVGVTEELTFRGVIQRGFERRFARNPAALCTSTVYALMHAINPGNVAPGLERSARGALRALGEWLLSLFNLVELGPTFLGMFLFGMLLTAIYRRAGHLWISSVVHGTGVWVVFSYGGFTDRASSKNGWLGGRMLVDGLPAWILLGALVLLLWPRGGGRLSAAGTPVQSPDPGRDGKEGTAG